MADTNDTELMDALRRLPPLFPRFLQRRRIGLTKVSELAAELGVERPLVMALVHVVTSQGAYGEAGVTRSEFITYDPYFVVDHFSPSLDKLEELGLVSENSEGVLSLSKRAREVVGSVHEAATAYVAGRIMLSMEDTERLADELEKAAHAVAADPAFAPFPGSHLAGFRSTAHYGDRSQPMVRLEQAIMDLWGARDDAFTGAWHAADMEGPPLDVLWHIWSGITTVDGLAEALKGKQNAPDIESSLLWLVEREYVQREGDALSITPRGVIKREDIENETDRVYFAPWPHTLDEVIWTGKALQELVDKLAPPQP